MSDPVLGQITLEQLLPAGLTVSGIGGTLIYLKIKTRDFERFKDRIEEKVLPGLEERLEKIGTDLGERIRKTREDLDERIRANRELLLVLEDREQRRVRDGHK